MDRGEFLPLGYLFPLGVVRYRVAAGQYSSGTIRQIMPAASSERPLAEPNKVERKGQELTNFFEVVMEFPNPNGELKEGMTGTARIYGKRYPVAVRALRAGWRWARSLIW